MASAAATSSSGWVEGTSVAGLPSKVFQLLLLALRNSADRVPTARWSVVCLNSEAQRPTCHRAIFIFLRDGRIVPSRNIVLGDDQSIADAFSLSLL